MSMNDKTAPSLLRNKAVVATMAVVALLSVIFIIWAVSSTPKEPNPIEDRNAQNAGGAKGGTPAPAGGTTFDNGNVRVEWNKGPKNEIQHEKHATPPPSGKSGKMY